MNIDINDEILQDFLVEAGEILEQLSEQLVELEQAPDNSDLLNAVFRGFHTIKGGAGFLNLTTMVDVCHRAEDVFNSLRQGQRQVDTELMDAVLRVLDVLNNMFASLHAGNEPTLADRSLLTQLEAFAQPQEEGADNSSSEQLTSPTSSELAEAGSSTANEVEPDAGSASVEAQQGATESSDTITDDEFEALLDQLHGKGNAPEKSSESNPAPAPASDCKTAQNNISEQTKPSPSKPTSEKLSVDNHSGPKGETKAKPPSESTVRVDTRRLDEIMNLVGELVLARNRLSSLYSTREDEEISRAVSNLDTVTSALQVAVMKTRMQPINKVFGRFPRVVRDLARNLDKDVELELRGKETDLDKNLVEALADPLVHLVRNAIDHGIESPIERESIGKSCTGKVLLSASQEGDHILLTVEDDGKGMDADKLRHLAVEKGLLDAETAQRLSDQEAYNLIFMPGFSTKTVTSDISGRGVGMDVVKTRIGQLNGSIEIFSERGKGSRICVKVPLTLAILSTLMVMVGNQSFALPLSCVDEILDFDPSSTKMVETQEIILVRQKPLPVFFLHHWLVEDAKPDSLEDSSHVVVVQVSSERVGLVVDQLVGQEEVVIKPLGEYLKGLPGYAGATITGDGRIALILDVVSLMKAKVWSS